jgi:hypothetical protein
MHNSLKIIKTLLYSYSDLHVSGTLAPIIKSLLILHIQPPVTVCRWVGCVFQLWSVTTVAKVMHNSLKTIKTLLYSYSALHVSGTLAPVIRSLLILHIQPPVTVCHWVGCIFQLWSVTTVANCGINQEVNGTVIFRRKGRKRSYIWRAFLNRQFFPILRSFWR